MAKVEISKKLYKTGILKIDQFSKEGQVPYTFDFGKIISDPVLFDDVTLLSEKVIKSVSGMDFDKICAVSVDAIPYATNIATSFEKGIMYITDDNHDRETENIHGLKINGKMNVDDKILLIDTVTHFNHYLNNVITKITKYGGNIAGILLIFNRNEGEYLRVIKGDKHKVHSVLNIVDILMNLENNQMIEMYFCEKVKFYYEKKIKEKIKKMKEEEDNIHNKEQLIDNSAAIGPMPSQ